VLLCDEVTSALDVSVQASILELLIELREGRDLAIVFVTHDLDEACFLADRIMVMGANPGRVLEVPMNSPTRWRSWPRPS